MSTLEFAAAILIPTAGFVTLGVYAYTHPRTYAIDFTDRQGYSCFAIKTIKWYESPDIALHEFITMNDIRVQAIKRI